MAKFVVFFIAALAFHAALAAPKRKQDSAAPKTQVDEIIEQVDNVVVDVTNSIKKVMPDQEQVVRDITAGSQKFATDVEDIVKKLQAEIGKHKGTTDTFLQQAASTLTENINSLKQAIGPDATAKATDIKTQIETQVKNTATEFEKLRDIVKPNLEQAGESINNFAQGILNDFLKATENLKNQVDQTVEGKTKSLKHKATN